MVFVEIPLVANSPQCLETFRAYHPAFSGHAQNEGCMQKKYICFLTPTLPKLYRGETVLGQGEWLVNVSGNFLPDLPAIQHLCQTFAHSQNIPQ